MKRYPRVLTIAGSDSGGGAGIQADIKAISATGSYAASAITAVTVQNTLGVRAVHNIPPEIVKEQISAVLEDIGADAVKIGMLSSAGLVMAVREALVPFGIRNMVLDPVMVATSGDRLIDEDAVEVMVAQLAPLARVITPNIPEAEILSGSSIRRRDDLPAIAKALSERISIDGTHKVSVLLKAGHLDDNELSDCFYNAEQDHIVELRAARIDSRNTHGTGCTLSSALASYLARGFELEGAVKMAREYLLKALSSGAAYDIGHGHGPVNHFFGLE